MTTIDDRRQEIIREVAGMLPRRRAREPWMFTAQEVSAKTGRFYARVLDDLKALVRQGVLKMDRNGYDPATGRRATLFWRPEDEPGDLPF